MTRPTFGRPLGAPRHRRRLPRPGQMALGLPWAPEEVAARRHLVVLRGGALVPEPAAPAALRVAA